MDYIKKKALFKKFRDRQLSETELEDFLNLAQQGAFDKDYEQIMTELEAEELDYKILSNSISKQKVKEKLFTAIKPDRKRTHLTWLMKAASVAVLLSIAFGSYRAYQAYQFKLLTRSFVTVVVPEGKITQLTLGDGTKVTLSPGAIFKYPKAFEKNARKVSLVQGRAFFDVSKELTKPFTVTSNRLATTVLGTSFVVQNYQEYDFEKVSLYTGKVKIEEAGTNKGAFVLWPGQEFEKSKLNEQGLLRAFSTTKDPLLHGKLAFDQDRLDIALYHIANYYQVKLQFKAKELQKEVLTGKFEFKNVEDLLKSLAFTHQLNVKKINAKTYMLMSKN